MKKILFGITGIGFGHTYRQMPLVEHFLEKGDKVAIFAYDESLVIFQKQFADVKNIKVVEVAVPFFAGGPTGLDFRTASTMAYNTKDFYVTNFKAWAEAKEFVGKPDLVISDYDPVSAQYAYSQNSPLVTYDQQSKYLVGDFPENISGTGFADEVERLHMFFPKVSARIASSFFNFEKINNGDEVSIFPPTINKTLLNSTMGANKTKENKVLVHISKAKSFNQPLSEIFDVFNSAADFKFYVFTEPSQVKEYSNKFKNINFFEHDTDTFHKLLPECSAVVSSAGHSLISEALYLNTPLMLVPISTYEQYMNAKKVEEGGFGVSVEKITSENLKSFLRNLGKYVLNIQNDTKIILKGVGQEKIIEFLNRKFLNR